ncbi:hypothetical protein BABINDRAFT_158847 [Babjeviella inositovora NRRL Y-12698]|uniref:Uncharacterized protein n=1 Tax=Babjeviella inositovora NRRL Y-12698 TaxID=984486 RepID=A0A1E3QX77_9ASCO|nr:uncharacterized protein BABINDRAFT_158847 [Babjeviella inositovora NRRL Y-12698]ODQ82201.1 hypothetical protein BABINDRAFT_158847 [Babjeviella inositovora NRRL Y-12698]
MSSSLRRLVKLGLTPMEQHNLETKKKEQQKHKKRLVQARKETLQELNIHGFLNLLRRLRQENGLEETEQGDRRSLRRLEKAELDLKFMIQNGLFKEEIEAFVKKNDNSVKEKMVKDTDSKLLGSNSIYYNPELNPLGQIPTLADSRLFKLTHVPPNLSAPLSTNHFRFKKYEIDADILANPIPMPEDSSNPPRFYKIDARYLDNVDGAATQVEYIGSEVVNADKVKRFVPASMRKKNTHYPVVSASDTSEHPPTSTGIALESRFDSDDEEKAELYKPVKRNHIDQTLYASEEEKYLNRNI